MGLSKKMNLMSAVKILTETLKNDPDYHRAWKANIAMAFKDEVSRYKKAHKKKTLSKEDIHQIANSAADNFLDQITKDQ